MKCIESLARVDVLCVDKTGTITENSMEVVSVELLNGRTFDGNPSIDALLSRFVNGMTGDNNTMKALKEFYKSSDKGMPDSVTEFS